MPQRWEAGAAGQGMGWGVSESCRLEAPWEVLLCLQHGVVLSLVQWDHGTVGQGKKGEALRAICSKDAMVTSSWVNTVPLSGLQEKGKSTMSKQLWKAAAVSCRAGASIVPFKCCKSSR